MFGATMNQSAFKYGLMALHRKRLGMTQQQLADAVRARCGRGSVNAIRRYEYGHREPPVTLAFAIADALGVTLTYLCGRGGRPPKPAEPKIPATVAEVELELTREGVWNG